MHLVGQGRWFLTLSGEIERAKPDSYGRNIGRISLWPLDLVMHLSILANDCAAHGVLRCVE